MFNIAIVLYLMTSMLFSVAMLLRISGKGITISLGRWFSICFLWPLTCFVLTLYYIKVVYKGMVQMGRRMRVQRIVDEYRIPQEMLDNGDEYEEEEEEEEEEEMSYGDTNVWDTGDVPLWARPSPTREYVRSPDGSRIDWAVSPSTSITTQHLVEGRRTLRPEYTRPLNDRLTQEDPPYILSEALREQVRQSVDSLFGEGYYDRTPQLQGEINEIFQRAVGLPDTLGNRRRTEEQIRDFIRGWYITRG